MRGEVERQRTMLSVVSAEHRIPAEHPLRRIKALADAELARLSPVFDQMYAERGRPSIPPERLLKSCLLIALYSIRSERQFCEQLQYNLLFQWFLDLDLRTPGFDRGATLKFLENRPAIRPEPAQRRPRSRPVRRRTEVRELPATVVALAARRQGRVAVHARQPDVEPKAPPHFGCRGRRPCPAGSWYPIPPDRGLRPRSLADLEPAGTSTYSWPRTTPGVRSMPSAARGFETDQTNPHWLFKAFKDGVSSSRIALFRSFTPGAEEAATSPQGAPVRDRSAAEPRLYVTVSGSSVDGLGGAARRWRSATPARIRARFLPVSTPSFFFRFRSDIGEPSRAVRQAGPAGLRGAVCAAENHRIRLDAVTPTTRHPQWAQRGARRWIAHSKLSNTCCSPSRSTVKTLS